MQGLSFILSAATLFLVLCLELGINKAQETTAIRKPLIPKLSYTKFVRENETVSVEVQLATEYKECLVVKAYLVSNKPIEGPFNYIQTRCLCNDYPITVFWDFEILGTLNFAVVLDLTAEKGICPNDVAVQPISFKRYYVYATVHKI
ncbi:prolactin-inducible protein homolog [Meriones unguiculatus]|uniref:prolactin-inducible protein homolog n=1 Tax=Meriones unguiculatus TaxID=10047 RepID=UPI000B4E84C5|nr:prolactin-inducible protein homolog [Meriones unguiculatus]